MKKTVIALLLGLLFFLKPLPVSASDYNLYDFPITPPIPCNQLEPNPRINCPNEMLPIYQRLGKPCATSYADFLTDPINKHYWVEDPNITAQGKADERARQFLYWVISTEVIEDAPVLRTVWNISSLIALFGVVLIAAIFGIGYIISQRTQYNFNIRIWPTIIKIGMMLLYIAFSSAIVFVLIQFSEILMKFFYENLGGNELFNIYFAAPSQPELIGQSEQSYIGFVGCRDLNIRVKDGIDAEVTMLKLTNVTYYVMGTMLLLRKILLWFILFVSPFLALLMPFVFIRNTGWIWIGVFFQWLFYGPLFTLFLGALAKIWREGIPWNFDFSRTSVSTGFIPEGYVYPTGINIVYGGPAQRITSMLSRPIDAANNGSYVDTYAEYILTLIMLWAVTFFPWWLLRIFRDYCCEGIFAMKNILLAMYNQMQQNNAPPGGPIAPKAPTLPSLKLDLKTPVGSGVKVPLSSINNFATLRTGDIAKNLNLQATRISDVARAETNKLTKQSLAQNISYLSNPVKATTPAERQQYMKLRAELFNRAIKNDTVARTMLASTSSSQIEKSRLYKEVLTTIPQTIKVTVQQVTAADTKQSQQTINNITNTYTSSVSNNNSVVNTIANASKTSQEVVKNILQSYSKQAEQPISNVIKNIAQETKTSESTVKNVLSQSGAIGTQAQMVAQVTQKQKLSAEQTTRILDSIRNTISNSQTTIEKIAGNTNVNQATVKTFVSNVYNTMSTNEQHLQQVASQTGASTEQVKTILTSYSSKISKVNEAPQTVINQIAKETNTNQTTVQNVINTTNNALKNSNVVNETATQQNITNEQAQSIVSNLSNVQSTKTATFNSAIEKITNETNVNQESVKSYVSDVYSTVTQNEENVQQIANQTSTTQEQVKNIVNSYSTKIATSTESPQTIINQISQETNANRATVEGVINSANTMIKNSDIVQTKAAQQNISNEQAQTIIQTITAPEATAEQKTDTPVANVVAEAAKTSETASKEIVKNILGTVVQNDTLVANIEQQTGLKKQQISNIINTYSQNIDQPATTIVEKISQAAGVKKEDVRLTLGNISSSILTSTAVVEDVAEKEKMKTEDVANVIQSQMQIATAPEQNIEKSIPIPQSVSLEDYEEVKKMWMNHYEEGDVPVSENIQNRAEWIEHETVFITNTLNKLLSTDEKLRQQGLDELGYLLPVFLINNLKGDELIVYLKAKLEAAKTTSLIIQHENKVREKITKENDEDTEVFIDIKPTVQADKHMEFDEDQDKGLRSIEDRVKAVQTKLSDIEDSVEDAGSESFSMNMPNISSSIKSVSKAFTRIVEIARSETNKELVSSTANEMTAEDRSRILTTLPQQSVVTLEKITASQTKQPQQTIKNITTSYTTSIANNTSVVQNIAKSTNTTQETVKDILQNYTQHLDQPLTTVIKDISQATGANEAAVRNVLTQSATIGSQAQTISKTTSNNQFTAEQTTKMINVLRSTTLPEAQNTTESATPLVKVIAQNTNTTEAASKEAVQNIMNTFIANDTLINNIAEQTGLKKQQVTSIITTYSKNIDQPAATIIERINQVAGIAKGSVNDTLQKITDTILTSSTIIHDVAEKEGMKEEEVAEVIQNQMQIAADPEQHIEKTIPIPDSVSLEDYEEVKNMWMNHYENSEIPLSDTVKDRFEWLEHEIIFITNTLNKLLSTDEKLRQQGLDEVGYLLPIFLINNLKGEELIVYLKAKLEAAKAVLAMLKRESQLRDKIEATSEEVLVDVASQTPEAKEMAVDLESETNAPQSIESKVQSVQDKLSSLEGEQTDANPLDSIKQKLAEGAEKKEVN